MDNNDEEKSSMNNNKSSFHIPEGNNEEFSCDHLIQMQESVEDCTLLTDGYHSKLRAFFFCLCDPDCQEPICEACLRQCHREHWVGHSIEDIPTDFRKTLCHCGQQNHNIQNTQKDFSYNPSCLFMEWSEVMRNGVYYEDKKKNKKYCMFCYNLCMKREEDLVRKTNIEGIEKIKCDCRHEDYNVIFELFGKLCKVYPFNFETLRPTHFINVVLLSKDSFINAFHNAQDTLEYLSVEVQGIDFSFDFFVNNMSFMKAIDKLDIIIDTCKSNYYFGEFIKESDVVFSLLNKKFDYSRETNIWLLKKSIFNIYHKTYFQKEFELLPKFTYKDFLNLNPFQRLMLSDFIVGFPNFDLFLGSQSRAHNYIDNLLKIIEKYKNIGHKPKQAYEILKILYSECKSIIRYNRLSPEQCMKFYSLNDEIIYTSINTGDIDCQSALPQMKMLNHMVKSVLYLAFYYNDNVLKQYLIKGNLEIDHVSFFHSSNETAKMAYKNCIHILHYCRTIYNETTKGNQSLSQTTLNKYGDIEHKISKYHNKIMFIATEIMALTLNYPDAYLYGLRTLESTTKETMLQYINEQYKEEEREVVENLKDYTCDIEGVYSRYFSFELNGKEVEKEVQLMIEKIMHRIGKMNYKPPDKLFSGLKRKATLAAEGIFGGELFTDKIKKKNKGKKFQFLITKSLAKKKEEQKSKTLNATDINNNSALGLLKEGKTNIDNETTDLQKSPKKVIDDETFRILINKTPLVFSIIKSLDIILNPLIEDPLDMEYYKNPNNATKGFPSDEYLEALFKFLFYFVTDSPDNCLLLLTEKTLKTFLLLPDSQTVRFIGLLEYMIKILKKNEYCIAQVNQLIKTIEIICMRLNDQLEFIFSFEHLLTILKSLCKLTYLHQEHTLKKMRKIIKRIYVNNQILDEYKNLLIRRDKNAKTLGELIQNKEKIKGYDIGLLSVIFTKFLKIVNYLFDGNSTLNECSFLSKIFQKKEIPYILKDKTLNLPMRIEILKFFRIIYIDVIIAPNQLNEYYEIFGKDTPINDNGLNFTLFQDLLQITEKNLNVDIENCVLNYELRNFAEIVDNSNSQNHKLILEYFEGGIILPLHVFLNKYMSIMYNLNGSEFIKLYEIVLYFLELKKYLCEKQTQIDNQAKNSFSLPHLFKSLLNAKKNKYSLIQKNINQDEYKKLLQDIQKIQSSSFEILNYKLVYSYFKKNVDGFIQKPKSKYLKDIFSKKDKIYTEEDVLEKEKEYKKIGMLKTEYENKLWEFILRYENDKTNFIHSSLSKNLSEKNILYETTYRSIMLRPMFYLINKETLYLKYRRQNLWHIFRLLQYDTGGTQEDILALIKSDIENKVKLKTVNLLYLTNIFIQNLLSLIFSSCNPSVTSINEDYTIAYMVIKIMKYMCEDHNIEFQTIFFKEIKIDVGGINQNKQINMFDFMMCTLSKIAILARWDDVKFNEDENSISYFYEIFFVMIEFSIEMIQGTSRANLNRIIKSKEIEKTYFYKFLCIVKAIVTNNNNNSEIVYNVRLDIINFIVAFLEEKNSPQKLINVISNLYNPLTIFDSIVNTLKKLYLKYANNNTKISSADIENEEFDNKKCKFFIEKYFSDTEFSESQEFIFVNRMYNYVKLLSSMNNKDALLIIDSIKLYTEDELMDICNQKKKKKNNDSDKKENIMIDPKYCENYFTVKFLETITREVWIQGEDTKPQLVIFTLNPLINLITQESKTNFYRTVQRDSRSSKLFGLVEYCNYFFIEINYNKKRRNKIIALLNNLNYTMMEAFLFLITCVINVIIFLLNTQKEALNDYLDIYNKVYPLGILEVLFSFIFIVCWMVSKFKLNFIIEVEKYVNRLSKESTERKLSSYDYFNIIVFNTILSKKEIISFIWNIIFSLLAVLSSKNIYIFSIQLLIVVNLSETLQNIVKAISLRINQLLTTFMFLFIIIYIFSMLAFFFFSGDFIHVLEGNQENTCGSLLYCFLTHMNYGLRTDGGIGDWISKSSFIDDPNYFIGMFLFQFLFFVIIIVVMLAVIGGNVIDTFAELREKAREDFDDMSNVCYICGGRRDEIGKQGENFEEHLNNVHNMWTYVDYIIGLKTVDPQETNAINSFVIDKLEEKKISWFPSFSVEGDYKKDNDDSGSDF